MTIKAVVFDIGNVLLEWQPERFYDDRIGVERRKAFFADVPVSAMNLDVDRGAPFAESVQKLAAAYPDWSAEIMLWHDNWLDMASPAIDHSVRLMQALQSRGIPVFSLTNFGVDTYRVAAAHYPFLDGFDRDYISGHLKMIKPDPGIYEMLEADSGICGDALIFTDDRAENIAAAERRGWRTHHFDGPQGWADRLVAEGLLSRGEAA